MTLDTSPSNHARDLAARYDTEADVYQELWAPVLASPGRALLDALPVAGARRVLDLGTGVGTLLPAVRAAVPGAQVVGVDRSAGMLRHAPPSFPRVVMDAAALGFRPASFDVIVMAFMLFHLASPLRGLEQAARVLRPGGALGVVTWGRSARCAALEVWTEALDDAGADADPCPANHDLLDRADTLRQSLGAVGLQQARAWSRTFEYSHDPQDFVRLVTTGGASGRRLDTLPPRARASFLARARDLVSGLDRDAFVARREVVFATARRPAAA